MPFCILLDRLRGIRIHDRVLALAVMTAVLLPDAAEAQSATRCEPARHVLTAEARDSALQALEADEIAVTGFVVDEATGEPVAGLVVRIDGTSHATYTDREGGYLFRHLWRDTPAQHRLVHVCSLDWEYLTEARELFVTTPWSDIVVVVDGVALPNPGHAVRLDFRVRRRPAVF